MKEENMELIKSEVFSLREEGKTYYEIKKLLGISEYKVLKILKNEYSTKTNKYGLLSEEMIEKIKILYNEIKNIRKVSKELGVSKDSVRKYVEILKPIKLSEDELKNSNVKKVIDWRRRAKIKLVEYKGSKCELCGYSKCLAALEFHHKDPKEKDFNISHKSFSLERLKNEVDKCMLVCSNCHKEIHSNLLDKNLNINLIKIEEEKKKVENKNKPKEVKKIKNHKNEKCFCGKVKTKSSEKCLECFRKEQYDKKPKLEVLLKDVDGLGYCGTGRKYGVSDNSIRKWIKSIIKFEEK